MSNLYSTDIAVFTSCSNDLFTKFFHSCRLLRLMKNIHTSAVCRHFHRITSYLV